MKANFSKITLTLALISGALTLSSQAAAIAINFAENTNQVLSGSDALGPGGVIATNWNSTIDRTTGELEAGTLDGLKDSSGAVTAANLSWIASGTWYNADGVSNDARRLAVGYLDDGDDGIAITITGIPYAQYIVYGLLASDQGGNTETYTTLDFQVNGNDVLGGSATAYKGVVNSWSATGEDWTPLTTDQVGNYWTSETQTSSTLTVTGLPKDGNMRGSITGLVIQQVPEPSITLLGGLGLIGLLRRRR